MADTRKLFKLEYNGSFMIIENQSDLIAIIENEIIDEGFEIGEEFTISKIEMTQRKYENLPEFCGW